MNSYFVVACAPEEKFNGDGEAGDFQLFLIAVGIRHQQTRLCAGHEPADKVVAKPCLKSGLSLFAKRLFRSL